MSQVVIGATNSENDDLTCPITLQVFRDPVIAADGHVYEREAITKWIFEHGTSPLTREPLQINELQPDDYLRRLAAQRRNSIVSYNARENIVTLPSLERGPTNIFDVPPAQRSNPVRINDQIKRSSCRIIALIIGLSGIAAIITIGIIFGIKSPDSKSSTSLITQVTSNYSNWFTTNCLISIPIAGQATTNYLGSLTTSSLVFTRPRVNYGQFYYKAIQMIVSSNGSYSFESVSCIDMYGLLYKEYFNSTAPWMNLLRSDDDSAGNQQFYIKTFLQPDNYTLVATTYSSGVTGNFSIVATGSGNFTFQQR